MSSKKGRPVRALLLLFVGVAAATACGSTEKQAGSPEPAGGEGGDGASALAGSNSGGATGRAGSSMVAGISGGGAGPVTMLPPGISDMPSEVMCDGDACKSGEIAAASIYIDPCCDDRGACGLNTSFLSLLGAKFTDVCQAHAQPGVPSDACPSASGLSVPFQMGGASAMVKLDPFVGCCRDDGKCGVVIDKVTTAGGLLPLASFGLGCVEAAPFNDGKVTVCGDAGGGGAGGAGGAETTGSAGADAAGASAGGAGGAP